MELNGANIPEAVVARVIARRGAAHSYSAIEPTKTALVVIDLQNAFMDDAVGHSVLPAARDIVPNVNRLAAALRDAGGAVFWVQNTHDERCLTEWSILHQSFLPAMRDKRIAASVEGSKGHELWPQLDVKPSDEKVKKYRYSAFLPGVSDLPERLSARGLNTVLIAGTATNVCCESSARDAMMRNFLTLMVSDANAAATFEEHNATLISFYAHFGDVVDTDMLVSHFERFRRPTAA